MKDGFGRIEWQSDSLVLDGFEYRFEKGARGSPGAAPGFFRFYKNKLLLDQYERFWARHPDFGLKNLFEIGIWDGGSVAFWNDLLRPERHVAIDRLGRNDSPYFQEFVKSRERHNSISSIWETNQANRAQLREIVNTHFDGPLDLVLDDGSHQYHPTRASFETLFPLLRVGGFYIIEDWAWAHWIKSHDSSHRLHKQIPLTKLVMELIEASGTNLEPIRSVSVFQGFAAVEKGILDTNGTDFDLDDHIVRPPVPPQAASKPASRLRQLRKKLSGIIRNKG